MVNQKNRSIHIVLLLGVFLSVCVHESRAQVRTIDTIALSTDSGLSSGDPVIGVGGNVAVDSFGKVMFFVTMERDNDTSTREFYVATSDGTATSVLTDFNFLNVQKPKPILNATGTIAFPWFEGINETSKNGIYIGSNLSGLAFVDAKIVAPPSDPDVKFLSAGRPTLNQSGFVAFTVAGDPLGGQLFLGTGSGGFTQILTGGIRLPMINARGDVVVSTQKKISFYSNQAGQLQTVVESGVTILPGLDNGNDFNITGEGIAIGPNGEVLFEAVFSPQGRVPIRRMWRWTSPNTFEPLFDTIKPSSLGFDVDTQVKKGGFVITDSGDLVFRSGSLLIINGLIQNDSRVKDAIWKETGDTLELIAHAGLGVDGPGSIAPGIGVPFVGFSDLTANGAGMVAFIGRYDIADQNVHGRGLWAQDSDGVLQLVALDGGELMTRDGMKTIGNSLILSGQSNVSGFSSSYNNKFELAFIAAFDDGTSGIFLAALDDIAPTDGNAYFWNRGCGDDNWHTICAGMTNWLDAENLPHMMPPGASGDENVTIAMNSDVGVTLDQEDAQIGKLTAIGKLIVRKSLTLNEPSTVESLVFDSLDSQVIVNDKLTITGNDSILQAGTVTINGDGGIVNKGTVTAELFPLGAAPDPNLTFEGSRRWTNAASSNFVQQIDILINTVTVVAAIENAKDATWLIDEGSLLIGDLAENARFTNKGELFKRATDREAESFIDLFFEGIKGSQIKVDGGALTLRGGGTFDLTGFDIRLDGGDSTLRLSTPQGTDGATYLIEAGENGVAGTGSILFDTGSEEIMIVENGAVLRIAQGATFVSTLRRELDGERGGFVLNDTAEISLAGKFQNFGDFIWNGGKLATEAMNDATNLFENHVIMTISGTTGKILAGVLKNVEGEPRRIFDPDSIPSGKITLSNKLTIADGLLDNGGDLFLSDDAEIVGMGNSAMFKNTGLVSYSASSSTSLLSTISVPFSNTGTVSVSQEVGDTSASATLKFTDVVEQLQGDALVGGTWKVFDKAILDFNGSIINTIGAPSGPKAIVELRDDATINGFDIKLIEKTGCLDVDGNHTLSTTTPLVVVGSLIVGESTFFRDLLTDPPPEKEAFVDVGGDLDVHGILNVTDTGKMRVSIGIMTLHEGSKTTIDGEVTIISLLEGDRPKGTLDVLGELKGSGTVNATFISQINTQLEMIRASRVCPGDSPGTLTLNGDFTQEPGTVLEIEIGGTDVGNNQDQLVINGNADIGGTLVLKFIDDFSPTTGQSFDFLSVSGTQTGEFESVEIVDLAEGFEFEVSPTDTGFMMTALSDGVFTGIPGEVNEVNKGFNTPEAETSAESGDTNVPMLQFEIVPEGDGLSINSLTLSASGSGDDLLDVANVTVWLDEDDNGVVGIEESAIGLSNYDADNGTLILSIDPPLDVAGRETVQLLVAYDIAEADENVGVLTSAKADASHDKHAVPSSHLSIGLAALILPLIIGVGFVARRKPKSSACCGLTLAMMVWVTGCPTGGVTPGPVPTTELTPVTFMVTLTAIDAEEAVTGNDASVDNLALSGTTLTVLR